MKRFDRDCCCWCSSNQVVEKISRGQNSVFEGDTTARLLLELLALSSSLLDKNDGYRVCADCTELVSSGTQLKIQLDKVKTELRKRTQRHQKDISGPETRRNFTHPPSIGQILSRCFQDCAVYIHSNEIHLAEAKIQPDTYLGQNMTGNKENFLSHGFRSNASQLKSRNQKLEPFPDFCSNERQKQRLSLNDVEIIPKNTKQTSHVDTLLEVLPTYPEAQSTNEVALLNSEPVMEEVEDMHLYVKSEPETDFPEAPSPSTEASQTVSLAYPYKSSSGLYQQTIDPKELCNERCRYACGGCAETFNSIEDKNDHEQLHRVQYGSMVCFKCGFCELIFAGYPSLKLHLQTHLTRPLACGTCGLICATPESFKKHQVMHNSAMPTEHNSNMPAALQLQNSTSRYLVEASKQTENPSGCITTEEKPFQCTACHKRFSNRTKFIIHVKLRQCDQSLAINVQEQNKTNLPDGSTDNTSTESHATDKQHSSTKCLLNCSPSDPRERITHDLISRKMRFECVVCNKKFGSKHHLEHHYETHAEKKNLDPGDKPFESPSNVISPKVVKSFDCEVCNKKFASKYHLARHFRIHTGEKPYKCRFCSKSFCRRDTLDKHSLIHLNSPGRSKPGTENYKRKLEFETSQEIPVTAKVVALENGFIASSDPSLKPSEDSRTTGPGPVEYEYVSISEVITRAHS